MEYNESLITYLYQSIADVQGTIRQLDLKANAILVFLTLLLTVTNHIGSAVVCVLGSKLWVFGYIFATVIPAAWFFAIFSCYRVLSAVLDPSDKVRGIESVHGTFFGPSHFSFNLADALFGRGRPRKRPTLGHFLGALPSGAAEIRSELAFEQLKLFYIRDIKAIRLRYASLAAFCCLTLSAIVWLLGTQWTGALGGE